MMLSRLTAIVIASVFVFSAAGMAETIDIKSGTPAGVQQLLRRDYAMGKTVVKGVLTFPAGKRDKVPAMVIVHGSGGISDSREGEWARRFNALGIAALVVDSFGPRGIANTSTDQSKLSTWANVADALNALKVLAADPRIDGTRIGIIGFSKGGQVSLYTALEIVRKSVIDDDLKFAIHVPLYPACNTRFVASAVTGAPLSVHLAEKDDYTPIGPCQEYARWFEGKGVSVKTTVYPDAYHAFDASHFGFVNWLKDVQTARNCSVETDLNSWKSKRLDTNEVFPNVQALNAYYGRCMQRGAHVGGTPEARQQVVENVLKVLEDTLTSGAAAEYPKDAGNH